MALRRITGKNYRTSGSSPGSVTSGLTSSHRRAGTLPRTPWNKISHVHLRAPALLRSRPAGGQDARGRAQRRAHIHAARDAEICLRSADPISIRRGFIASGTSRARSIRNSPIVERRALDLHVIREVEASL